MGSLTLTSPTLKLRVDAVRRTDRSGPSLPTSVCFGAVSGAVALLASPPFSFTWLLPLALLPWLIVARRAGAAQWALAGFGFAAAYLPSILAGLLAFGVLAVVSFYGTLALFLAGVFALSGAVARRLPIGLELFALPAVWTFTAWVLDEWLYAPVLLGAPAALQHPEWAQSLAWWGAPGFDGLLLCCTAWIASAISKRIPLRGFLLGAAVLLAAFLAPITFQKASSSVVREARVTVVQPNIPWADFKAAGWSPMARRSIEERLDNLTRQAAAQPESLIIWPENGNGLPNAQLARRRAVFAATLGRNQLLLTGKEVESGQSRLAAFLAEGGDILGRVSKANLVPLAESSLTRGDAGVLATRQGRMGVAICYDAMFGRHFRRLVTQGAEAFAVTTDDASLGSSSLSEWHAAYSVTRAIEAGRSLIFASNGGPSRIYDRSRNEVRVLLRADQRGIATAGVPLGQDVTPAMHGMRHLVPALALLLIGGALGVVVQIRGVQIRGIRIREVTRPTVLHYTGAILLLPGIAGAALAAELGGNSLRTGNSLRAITEDAQRRAVGYGAMDGLGPVFRQSEENACGAAALAFALQLLGDNGFEHDLTRDYPRAHEEGYSLAELQKIARARGFEAQGFTGSVGSLSELKTDAAVVHMRRGHYAVVWKAVGTNEVHLFDSAVGAVLRVPLQRVEQVWSGNYLRVRLAPIKIVSRISTRPYVRLS